LITADVLEHILIGFEHRGVPRSALVQLPADAVHEIRMSPSAVRFRERIWQILWGCDRLGKYVALCELERFFALDAAAHRRPRGRDQKAAIRLALLGMAFGLLPKALRALGVPIPPGVARLSHISPIATVIPLLAGRASLLPWVRRLYEAYDSLEAPMSVLVERLSAAVNRETAKTLITPSSAQESCLPPRHN